MKVEILRFRTPPSPGSRYDVVMGRGLLGRMDLVLQNLRLRPLPSRYVIITDNVVKKIYGRRLYKELKQKRREVELLAVPPGETSKNSETKEVLEEKMLAKKCGRDTLVLALGGGVVGDLAGFVAATYMRGIPYIQIPTTLLAMVDSAIGGKVAVNTKYGKNTIGAFWHPAAVICDLDCLKNLPIGQLINGLVETVKIFMAYDAKNFNVFANNIKKMLDRDFFIKSFLSETFIKRAITLKAELVSRDPREGNERMIINFGHTIGHSLELLSNYKIPHGLAVGVGIVVESKISELLGILSAKDFKIVFDVMAALGIDMNLLRKFSAGAIVMATERDKKSRGGEPLYVLLRKIGAVAKFGGKFTHPVNPKTVKKVIELFHNS